ncbi:aspartate kinase, monofunctional class [Candidatus Endolissoclinum faulkneri L5]|uniref:Aspartokinase n=1 Tax=Candidatus Endolissoclinum faulkneri L5 TaxID=1401328 RepID=V9TR13_9PROT|nr:aspartate kinase [Candidatus Endolissoclinum faulkneri]AHC73324.1 aspartate kinase, monofunctional class [Candidatus Endolissoclinum faulkneri L5]
MARIVMKFGGTSVSNTDRIKNVARLVKAEVDLGNEVAVVVSAMSGTTDQLAAWSNAVAQLQRSEEYDIVVSSGEQITVGLLALALQNLGLKARSWLAWQIPIYTDCVHGNARIISIDSSIILKEIVQGQIAVVAGFQGIGPNKRITTLGRGGSDTSAVALAASLQADRCDIYTDVEGVYTTDPHLIAKARKIDFIAYEEMLELASHGAKVLHSRAVIMAALYALPVQVLSSLDKKPGTLIVKEGGLVEKQVVTSIAYSTNEAKVTLIGLTDCPGVAAAIFESLAKAAINVDMIVQNVSQNGDFTDLTFTVNSSNLNLACKMLNVLKKDLGYVDIISNAMVCKISVVGVGMRSQPGVAKIMFHTLAKCGINIQLITTSEIRISVLISSKYLDLALQALHTAYGLDTDG